MKIIYAPKGRAREYSPLALNHYLGCNHDCDYCFNKMRTFFTNPPHLVKNWQTKVAADAAALAGKHDQVLLSFCSDPYCKAEMTLHATRQVLNMFLPHRIPTAVLTKGGSNCLKDLKLFQAFGKKIKVGMTLTFSDKTHSLHYEPGAALPQERFDTLEELHANDVRTWVSIEPPFDLQQALDIIDITHDYVDEFQVGKLNGYNLAKNNPFNYNTQPNRWINFLHTVVTKLRSYGKDFYIKQDLRNYDLTFKLTKNEQDHNYLNVK
jgi:DNA repair photolyase